MFLLLGVRTKHRVVSTRIMTCELCGYEAPQAVLKRTTKFTLFFVPLFPVRRSSSYLQCHHCHGMRAMTPASVGTAG